jgi:chitin deacetylase
LYRTFDVGGQKLVTLTFDDGPWPGNTLAVTATLALNGLEGAATFFWIGVNVRRFPDVAREVARRGYTIGNHSMTHSTYSPAGIAAEVDVAQQTIADTVGIRPVLFRSPGLSTGPVLQAKLRSLGMCNIFTDVDPHDWVSPRISAGQIVANVGGEVHPGLPLLLHDGGSHQQTVDAVQGVIDTVRGQGYTIVTMAEMMQAVHGTTLTTERVEGYTPQNDPPAFSDDVFDVNPRAQSPHQRRR